MPFSLKEDRTDKLIDGLMEARKGVGTQIGVSQGIDHFGTRAVSIATDQSKFSVRVDVDFKYPDLPKAKSRALRKILSGTISHFPDMKMDDIIDAMQESLRDLVWSDDIMGEASKHQWMSTLGIHLRNPYTQYQLETTIVDIDDIARQKEYDRKKEAYERKRKADMSEIDNLKEKYDYVEDVKEMSLEELKELDKYISELEGNE